MTGVMGSVWVQVVVSPLHPRLGFVVYAVALWFWLAPQHRGLGFLGGRGGVGALLVPRRSQLGCAVWLCVLGLRFRLRPAAPGLGVGVCVCLCACSAWSAAPPGCRRGAVVCAWAWLAAAPRHAWLGCLGVCVFVCWLRLYPATPGLGVRCGRVCLGSGFVCAPPLLVAVSRCVCVRACAPLVPRHSSLGGVCVCGFGFRLLTDFFLVLGAGARAPLCAPPQFLVTPFCFLWGGRLLRGGVQGLMWVGFATPLPFCFFFSLRGGCVVTPRNAHRGHHPGCIPPVAHTEAPCDRSPRGGDRAVLTPQGCKAARRNHSKRQRTLADPFTAAARGLPRRGESSSMRVCTGTTGPPATPTPSGHHLPPIPDAGPIGPAPNRRTSPPFSHQSSASGRQRFMPQTRERGSLRPTKGLRKERGDSPLRSPQTAKPRGAHRHNRGTTPAAQGRTQK